MPADPNLEVSLLTPDEAPIYTRIRHGAFKQDVNKVFYSNAPNNEPSQATLDRVANNIRNDIVNNGNIFLKCVDKSTGDIVAGARWTYLHPKDPSAKELTWDEVNEELATPEPFPETNVGMWNAFYDLLHANKRKYMANRPHYALGTLITHEDHYRRGAGGLLLAWGLKKADEAGVEAYLESSMMGRSLYARYGFEPITDISLDLSKWGGKEEVWWTLMKRPARASSMS